MKRTLAALALAGVAAIGVAACGSDSKPSSADGGSPRPAQTDHSTDATVPPYTAPVTQSLHDRMAAWATGNGVSAKLSVLSTKLTDVSTAAGAQNVPQLDTAARALKDEIAADEAALTSSPDPALNALIGGALDHFDTSADDILAGAYTSATSELTAGTSQINQAASMVRGY